MLSRPLRLSKNQDFKRVYRKGRRTFGPHLRLFYLQRVGALTRSFSRFGFVVSKKHAGKTVIRNRLKRILRAEIASQKSTWPKGYEIIIQARPGILDCSRLELSQELENLRKKIVRIKS